MTLSEILRNAPFLEITANIVNLVAIALATRNSIHTWWTGIFGCVLFGWLFFNSQLYADVTLQLFFIITSIFLLFTGVTTPVFVILPVKLGRYLR